MNHPHHNIKMFLDYEIRSSLIAPFVSWGFAQELVAKYFAWKVKIKHRRYMQSLKYVPIYLKAKE